MSVYGGNFFQNGANNPIREQAEAGGRLLPLFHILEERRYFTVRKYMLASLSEREDVDLRDYDDVIIDAVHKFMPEATVRVETNCYYVDPTPSRGTAVKIGRKICQSELKQYCITIFKLFSSIEIEGGRQNGTKESRKSQHTGGHH